MEFPDPWFFPGSEIILFPGVPGEVVEFVPAILVIMNELPVPAADDCTWFPALVAIVRVVPEEVARGDFFALEEGDKAYAVDVLVGDGVKACQFEEGGIEIRPGHRGLAGCAGSGDPRGLDVVGFADPTLPLASLAAAVGEVAGGEGITGGDSTVIRGKDYDGVVGNSRIIEGLEDDADRVVHSFHHASVDGTVLDLAHRQGAVDEKAGALMGRFSGLIPVFLPEVRRGLDRAMDRVKGEKGKERGVCLVLDEGGGVISEAQREGLALRSIRHLWVSEGRKESSGRAAPVVPADVAVETVVFRERSLATKMPLPCEEGPVATLFERLGKAGIFMRKVPDVFRWQDLVVSLPVEPGSSPDPVGDSVTGGVFPGHNAGAGGRADLAGGVAMSEADAFFRDTIDVRRLVVGAAFNGEVPDSQVIGEDKENIGSSGKRMGPCEEKKGESAEHDGR